MMAKSKGINKSSLKSKHAGVHLIAEFWGAKMIESAAEVKKMLLEAAARSNNTPVAVKIHKFNPHGLTAFLLLAESHISIHTWPELGYVAVDFFSCGKKSKPYKGLEYLRSKFKPTKVRIKEIKRG